MRVAATVHLEHSEMLFACMAGVLRNIENHELGRTPRYAAACNDDNQGDFQKNIIGTVGEYVVAKHLGVTWPGKGVFQGDDVGHCQVRCSQGGRCLILHQDDPDEATFYFVRWRMVRAREGIFDFEVSEPVVARDGKRPEYWRTPDDGRQPRIKYPCFMLPLID